MQFSSLTSQIVFVPLSSWDKGLANKAAESGLGARWVENLRHGLCVTTEFSGFDAPRECCRIMAKAVSTALATKEPVVQFVRSCDHGKIQKQCLMLQSDMLSGGSDCVFSGITDRLEPNTREWIAAAGPTKDMDPAEARQANQLIDDFLKTSGSKAFSDDGRCFCEMHRQRCPVHAMPVLKAMQQVGIVHSDMTEAWPCPEPFPFQEKAHECAQQQALA